MRLRRLFHVGTVVLLVFCIDEGAPTLMLTSMLMAVKSGLMVGKMSLGGLIMMLMAANQNQNDQAARQSSLLKQTPLPFDILSLMSGSHSNQVPVTVTASPVPKKVYSAATTLSPTTTPIIKVSRRRVFKKKVIVRRDLSDKTLSANDKNETTLGENEIKDSPTLVKTMKDETITTNEIKDSPTMETIFDDSITNEIKKVLSLQKLENSASKVNGTVAAEEKEVQTRIFRQISNLDPLNCLPKVMCGVNTAPPSKRTNILNDYAYLMKTIFSRDDDDDNDKKPVTKNDKKKKNKKRKGGNKKKNDDDSDESFEEFVLNDDDFERLALKEEADIEDLVQHEMADEEPGFLPYILKDANHMTETDSSETNQDYPADDLGHEGGNEYSHSQSSPGGFPYRSSHHHPMSQHHAPRPNNSPGSLLSSFIPKISFGKNKGGKVDAFSSDPFFDGFKRSLDFNATEGTKTINITKEQDQLLKEIKMRRDKRNVYVMGKKKQIEMATDPGEKFQIAAEVGRNTKSARQCRALFDQCPFKYTEVLKMISNLRNAVQGQVENTADKVVNLVQTVPIPKATVAVQPVAAASNIINVSSGSGGEHGGITSISHQLPNGEKIEINLKVLGKVTTPSTTTTTTPTTTTSAPPKMSTINVTGKHPNDAEKIFDDDDETHKEPLGSATAQDTKKKVDSLESLESLKATLMAIEKINNATMDRKKQGKPITYSGIFHEVTGIGPVAPEKVPNESSDNESGDSSESYEDDEEEEDLPAPPPNIIKKPNLQEPKRPYRLRQAPQDQKHAYKLHRPSSPPHDEHKNPFPPRPQIRPQLRPQFHINKQQHRIHARTTTPTTTTTTPKIQSTTPKTTASASRNKLRPVATKPKGHKSSQKDEPVIVPYTEKETVVNPAKQKVSSQVNSDKKQVKKPSGAENSEDYDEGDIDGDDNDNNTSEEDEEDADDELRSEESAYIEQRLNIPHRPPHPHPQFIQNDSDDNEDDEADSDRVVIQPSITANAQQQMQRTPPPPPPPHSHPHPPNQSRPPHSPPQPPNPPQQLRLTFNHRRLKVSKSRNKRSRFPSNRRTVKRKHPNHRYPCSAPVESTTPATDNIKNHSLEDRQPIASPSTMSPPSLPYKYPQYRSPHKM